MNENSARLQVDSDSPDSVSSSASDGENSRHLYSSDSQIQKPTSSRMKRFVQEQLKAINIWTGIDRADDWDAFTVASMNSMTNSMMTDDEDTDGGGIPASQFTFVNNPASSWYGLTKWSLFRQLNAPVAIPSVVLVIIFLCIFGIRPEWGFIFEEIMAFIGIRFGWFYVILVDILLVVLLYLGISKFGDIKLGDDDEEPEFSYTTWICMLFSAGMGIGILFYGGAEPLAHYLTPPSAFLEGASDVERLDSAVGVTLFNWGVHAWAIYSALGLSIAYFSHRLNMPCSIRSSFYPLLGPMIPRWPGHIIDIIALFGTLFGLATSLGLGTLQINAGLTYLSSGSVPSEFWVQAVIICIVTSCAILSLLSGLNKGIRILSDVNMLLSALLMFSIWFCNDKMIAYNEAGSVQQIMDGVVQNFGAYIKVLISRSFTLGASDPSEKAWMMSWTLFYMGWFLSWCPFVSIFLARISRGRTVREFIVATLFVPTMISILWFTVLGTTAINNQNLWIPNAAECPDCPMFTDSQEALDCWQSNGCYTTLAQYPIELQQFQTYGAMQDRGVISSPTMWYLSVLTMIVLTFFFVSSSDSGSMVVDTLANGGQVPKTWQKVFWATVEGAVAIVLLASGAGVGDSSAALASLQAMVVSMGCPIAILLIFMIIGLIKTMNRDPFIVANPTNKRHPYYVKRRRKQKRSGGNPRPITTCSAIA